MSGLSEAAATVTVPGFTSPPVYASTGYQTAYASPPTPPSESIPAGAIVINHVINNSDLTQKRGRPKKFVPDNSVGPSQSQQPINVPMPQNFSPPPEQTASQPLEKESAAMPTIRKAMGRPRGSKNKKPRRQKVLGSSPAGAGFIPHILTVQPGEDVAQKIMAFSHHGAQTVCILSGTGAVANVALSQAAISGGTATYEGRFDILTLSGSFTSTDIGGYRSRSGGLSITLVGPDGRVFGGCVSGFLLAATPVQVVLGSFRSDGYGEPRLPHHMEPSSANLGGAAIFGSSSSRGTQSESSGEPASPRNLSSSGLNSVPQGMSGIQWN